MFVFFGCRSNIASILNHVFSTSPSFSLVHFCLFVGIDDDQTRNSLSDSDLVFQSLFLTLDTFQRIFSSASVSNVRFSSLTDQCIEWSLLLLSAHEAIHQSCPVVSVFLLFVCLPVVMTVERER